jgi:hypothetical protein
MITTHSRSRSLRPLGLLLALATALGGQHDSHAATSTATLPAAAIRNSDSVRTYREAVHVTTRSPKGTESRVENNQYDVQHNRGQIHADIKFTLQVQPKQAAAGHYTVDVIMMNGFVYHRSSQEVGGWRKRKGSSYQDPPSKAKWPLAPLDFTSIAKERATEVSHSASATHYRLDNRVPGATRSVSLDVWISTGPTPYIVRVDQAFTFGKNADGHFAQTFEYSAFNAPVKIQAPKTVAP